jgi:hypothetical protein
MRDDEPQARRSDAPTPESEHSGQRDAWVPFATLSAYLDDPSDFELAEQTRLDAYLTTPEGAARVAEVRLLATGLRDLPQVEPPRSFRLAPEQVGARAPVVLRETPNWYARHGDKLRWATAAAALLFVLVVSADLITHGVTPGSDDMDSAPASSFSEAPASGGAQAEATATTSAAQAEATAGEDTMALMPEDATEEGQPPPEGTPGADEAGTEPASGDAAEDASATQADGESGERNATEGEATPAGEATPVPEGTAQTEQAMLVETEDADAANEAGDSERVAQSEPDSSRSSWRIAEFSIVVVLVVLLTLLAILTRLARRRG